MSHEPTRILSGEPILKAPDSPRIRAERGPDGVRLVIPRSALAQIAQRGGAK